MSNQCRNCGRDVNNNYTPYTNAYSSSSNKNEKNANKTSTAPTTQITAKVMFGTVGEIRSLREKEAKNSAARAGRRQ